MNKLRKWLRIIHRDLGFLMLGLCLIYGISGILLNHINEKDFAFKIENKTTQLPVLLDSDELAVVWGDQENLPALKRITPKGSSEFRLLLHGGVGIYHSKTGAVEYEIYKKREFVYWINRMHYSKIKGWSPVADIFAVSLLFFALSGIFIVKGKKGVVGRGKWFLMAGILIPILYVIFS